MTGASSGIGRETARVLAGMGANVLTASRNLPAQQSLRDEILKVHPAAKVACAVVDLSNLGDLRRFADSLLQRGECFDVLINNAGAFRMKREITSEGHETTFTVNVLAPFLLTHLLLPLLDSDPPSRIVNVSSDALFHARLKLDDLELRRGYRGFRAYGASKLAMLLLALEMAERFSRRLANPPTVNSLHPGHVATGIWSGPGLLMAMARAVAKKVALSPEEGARTSVYLASAPEVSSITGGYFDGTSTKDVPAVAQDHEVKTRLWQRVSEMVGLEGIGESSS